MTEDWSSDADHSDFSITGIHFIFTYIQTEISYFKL